MNIFLIHHDHVHLTLSLADPAESNPSTNILRIPTHALGQNLRPGGGDGGASAPMGWPHHPLLRWPPIFACMSLISRVSVITQVFLEPKI